MKKNITINLFGSLYNIAEDACELLEKYLNNMKSFFSRREGGEEIAEDIECRVAEILAEKKAAGVEAVTIEHIEEIIKRIGNPEQMDEADETATTASGNGTQTPPPPPTSQKNAEKRFFRDPEDKMLGGVLSGLTHYFGGSDPLPWRIIFLILCFVTWSGLAIVYLVLWALIPEAKTAEDRLMMYGRPVNTQTLNEEIMRGTEKAKAFIRNPQNRSQATGCIMGILRFFVLCFKVLAIFFLGAMLFGVVIALFHLIMGGFMPFENNSHYEKFHLLLEAEPTLRWWLLALALMALTVVAMPLYAVVNSMLRRSDSKPTTRGRRLFVILIWILTAAATFTTSFVVANMVDRGSRKVDARLDTEERIENTRNGRYLTADSWEFLEQSGWKLLHLGGAKDFISEDVTSVFEEYNTTSCLSLHQKSPSQIMTYDFAQTLEVKPGRYRVVALVNTDGQGNAFYAKAGEQTIYHSDLKLLPTDSASVAMATLKEVWGSPFVPADTNEVAPITEWKAEMFEFDVPSQCTLQYGFSNFPEYREDPWTAENFKVSYLAIRRIGEATR